jgi:hypothetical protein
LRSSKFIGVLVKASARPEVPRNTLLAAGIHFDLAY